MLQTFTGGSSTFVKDRQRGVELSPSKGRTETSRGACPVEGGPGRRDR